MAAFPLRISAVCLMSRADSTSAVAFRILDSANLLSFATAERIS